MYFGKEMFLPLTDPVRQSSIFKDTVKRIEVETDSYGNRRCDYCPNVTGDRPGANVRMKPAVLQKLLTGLAEVDFAHAMALNSYNEPLFDCDFLFRIAQTRAALSSAWLMIFANGDYLTPGFVDETAAAGLNYLHVSIHFKRGEAFTDLYVLNRNVEVSHRIGRQVRFRQMPPGVVIIADFANPGMEIETR
jgi:MoaA/NifB/PqqE/SkfB family radical SAM enzyme